MNKIKNLLQSQPFVVVFVGLALVVATIYGIVHLFK